MGIDINAIRGRLNKLQSTQRKSDLLWKPTPGKHQVRIVPYKFDKNNPFIELYFHYNINNKTYLSPQSFNKPDPIVEFADKLKKMGDREDWKAAKAMEPKLRTFVPVLVRGKENEGVQFWGFGKTVYQEILGYIADPDYGDITDPINGRDITIDYKSAEESGTQYPTTTIRVKPKETPITQDAQEMTKFLDGQTEITDLYSELSYDELKKVLESWLNPTEDAEDDVQPTDKDTTTPVETPKVDEPVSTKKQVKTSENIADEFDELFAKKK